MFVLAYYASIDNDNAHLFRVFDEVGAVSIRVDIHYQLLTLYNFLNGYMTNNR